MFEISERGKQPVAEDLRMALLELLRKAELDEAVSREAVDDASESATVDRFVVGKITHPERAVGSLRQV